MPSKREKQLGLILPATKGSLREATRAGSGRHGGGPRQRHRRERRDVRQALRDPEALE